MLITFTTNSGKEYPFLAVVTLTQVGLHTYEVQQSGGSRTRITDVASIEVK
jgi:hypothetical protein